MLDWSQCPGVEQDPERLSGAVVVRGTRMPISGVFENLESGSSIEEIAENFGITEDQIRTILAFVAKSAEAPVHR